MRGSSVPVLLPTTHLVTNSGSNFALVLWPVLDTQVKFNILNKALSNPVHQTLLNVTETTCAHGDGCHLNSKQPDVTHLPKVCFQLFYRWLKQGLVSKVAFQSHKSMGIMVLGLNIKTEKVTNMILFKEPPNLVQTATELIPHCIYMKWR